MNIRVHPAAFADLDRLRVAFGWSQRETIERAMSELAGRYLDRGGSPRRKPPARPPYQST